ncbi:uncharacterized protein TNCV_394001 [Trichonephila clavipes]|nr:uncharacterized protein TNCV_394001 [Trichonephila clavipes]
MQIAAKEARDATRHSNKTVAIDVTSQKRGNNFLNGAIIDTGKVLGASNLLRFFQCFNKMHNENCTVNHFGNSGNMEVSGGIEIFQRSEGLFGLRYTKCFGDDDSRAYKLVNEMQPYEEIQVLKNWNVLTMSRNGWGKIK